MANENVWIFHGDEKINFANDTIFSALETTNRFPIKTNICLFSSAHFGLMSVLFIWWQSKLEVVFVVFFSPLSPKCVAKPSKSISCFSIALQSNLFHIKYSIKINNNTPECHMWNPLNSIRTPFTMDFFLSLTLCSTLSSMLVAAVNDLRKLKQYRRQQKRCQKTRFAFFSNIIEIDRMLDDDDFDICIRKPYVVSVVCTIRNGAATAAEAAKTHSKVSIY